MECDSTTTTPVKIKDTNFHKALNKFKAAETEEKTVAGAPTTDVQSQSSNNKPEVGTVDSTSNSPDIKYKMVPSEREVDTSKETPKKRDECTEARSQTPKEDKKVSIFFTSALDILPFQWC